MGRYAARRLLETIPLMLIISIFVFMFIHLLPGDPARQIAGLEATYDEVEAIRKEFGLDKPLIVQYFDYMKGLLTGNMGRSMKSNIPVSELIWSRFQYTIQLVFAGIGGWLGWFLGGCDGLLYALLAFVVIDYITGIMCAVVDKKLSSEVGFKGIFKKVLIFALVGIGHILDTRVIGSGSVMRTAVIFFYLSNEGVSLLENAAYLGLPIPQKLKSVLEQLHDRSEKEDE